MLFKLLRIDAEGKEIELPLGTYMVGKGKLLECDNEKIPFNVGCITVTKDQLTINPVHENKLFFKVNGSKKIQVLQQSSGATRTLKHGDSFGLLRKSFWYEVSHCAIDKENQGNVSKTEEFNVSDDKIGKKRKKRAQSGMNTSLESVSATNETRKSKRSHGHEESDSVRKSKRKSASKSADTDAAPTKPRERCMYGATCYSLRSLRRSNSEHKAQFCHPRDADWGGDGTGARAPAPCPLGVRCLRGGDKHWARYSHPPMARPPGPVPRTLANKYWRQHTALSASDSDSPPNSPKLLRKRVRARLPPPSTITVEDSEPEPEDPYATEGSDDWEPSEPETVLDYHFDHF